MGITGLGHENCYTILRQHVEFVRLVGVKSSRDRQTHLTGISTRECTLKVLKVCSRGFTPARIGLLVKMSGKHVFILPQRSFSKAM